MQLFAILAFVAVALFGDINMSFVKESNITIYKKYLSELNQSQPDYRLQKTLLNKIITLSTQKVEVLDKKDFSIKDDDDFVELFYKINTLLAQSEAKKAQIEDLQDQLEDIKSSLDTNNSLTTTLEYTYYYKQKLINETFIKEVESNYTKWLDKLLTVLPHITFDTKNIDSTIKKAIKSITYLQKKIRKLQIELERYTILEFTSKIVRVKKDIAYLQKRKERYIKTVVKAKLKLFFKALKQKDQKAFNIAKEIVTFLQKNSQDPNLAKAFNITTIYLLNRVIGSWKIKLINLKNQIVVYLNNNSIIGIPLYKFAEALAIFLTFLFFRKLFTLIILKSLHKLASLTKSSFDDKLLKIVEGPLKFSFIILGLYFAIDITEIESESLDKLLKTFIIFIIFWLLYNAVNILDESIYKFARKFGKELYREIGAFFIKTLKIFIFAIGLVSILQEWNINVSAFLASLGLGGLAFALAAKDTAANLFGGLSILADRALKIDDWIKVGDVEGTVEEIGLRTTKIRTFEKSLVTVPNQIIANNPIENFSRRGIRRIKMRIGLVYGTSKEQIDAIVRDIRNMLQSHPQIAKNATLLVNFDEFADSSLSIFIYCFTNTANWAKYLEIREDVNKKIMDIVAKHGSDFAFPSQSIYVEKLPKQ